jgi:hypothetical protein
VGLRSQPSTGGCCCWRALVGEAASAAGRPPSQLSLGAGGELVPRLVQPSPLLCSSKHSTHSRAQQGRSFHAMVKEQRCAVACVRAIKAATASCQHASAVSAELTATRQMAGAVQAVVWGKLGLPADSHAVLLSSYTPHRRSMPEALVPAS